MPWIGSRFAENIYLTHSGAVPGFLSMLAFNKLHRVAVIVLTNKQGHSVCGPIAFEALERLIGRLAKDAPARGAPPVPAPAPYKPLLGRYISANIWGSILHIEFRDGALLMVTPSDPYLTPPDQPAPLTPTDDPGVFIVSVGRPAGEPLAFELDAEGRVVGFVLGENGTCYRRTE